MKSRFMPPWWPHLSKSDFIETPPFRWHIQKMGSLGPKILLLHGTGASTHSWAPLMSQLENQAQLCAVDLPGHGYSNTPPIGQSTLNGCTRGIDLLLKNIDFMPDVIVGHSAGAAIAVSLAQSLYPQTKVICVNAAFGQFPGIAGILFPYFAKVAAVAPFSAKILALVAQDTSRVKRLLEGTGTHLPRESLCAYSTLFRSEPHVQGTLQFMAQWDLGAFLDTLAEINTSITFLIAQRDKTVPPEISRHWANKITQARLIEIPEFGHLIQEEAPELVADHIMSVAVEAR